MKPIPGSALAVALGSFLLAGVLSSRKKKDVTADRARSSRSVTIRGTDARELHALWHRPEHLETFFRGVPMEIVRDVPGQRFEWRTVRHRPFAGGGSLTFVPAPAARGTQARLALYLDGPAAPAVAAFSRLFGASPAQLAMESLRRFKALAESGEVPIGARA